MPNYDLGCEKCGHREEDVMEPMHTTPEQRNGCAQCGGPMVRVWSKKANSVIGDEIDVDVKHALCHRDGTPRHFTSRQELNRFAESRGYTNYVEHIPSKGSDKSPYTVRWVAAPSILTPEQELQHRLEWWIDELATNPNAVDLLPDDLKELVRNFTDNTEDNTRSLHVTE